MNARTLPVEFDLIKANAAKQGIDLQTIAIVYSGLTPEERNSMSSENLITHDPGADGRVIAHFRSDGTVAFPEKATSVLNLAAD